MKHSRQKQAAAKTGEIDRDLLARYLHNKMADEKLSARSAANAIGCSPATMSRLLSGNDSEYIPDTATLAAAARWLGMQLSDFESGRRPTTSTLSNVERLSEVEMHLHALPGITPEVATSIMNVVRLLYEQQRRPSTEQE